MATTATDRTDTLCSTIYYRNMVNGRMLTDTPPERTLHEHYNIVPFYKLSPSHRPITREFAHRVHHSVRRLPNRDTIKRFSTKMKNNENKKKTILRR